MKGQAELAVLVGIVILAVAVIGLVMQVGLFELTGFGQEEPIRESVRNLVRKGGTETIRLMELQGGYVQPPQDGLGFAGTTVAFWQSCQNTNIPNPQQIRQNFNSGLKDYIKTNLGSLKESFNGLVEFGEPQVSSNILANKIDFTVNLPMKIKGEENKKPYVVSIPTMFGEIYDFATNYADSSSRERYLDRFTKISLYLARELPTIGSLTSCGERIYLTEDDVGNELENIIGYTLTHTLWWESAADSAGEPAVYAIGDVNGKKYPRLDIRFVLPSDFSMEGTNSVNIKNNNRLFDALLFRPLKICVSSYNIKYDVAYPVIVSTKDGLTGNNFNFATFVYLKDNEPAACTDAINIQPGQDSCKDLACNARFYVEGSSGPLAGASTYFGDCKIGISDSAGLVEGPIKCGTEELFIHYNDEYETIENKVASNQIANAYVLRKIPRFKMNFNRLSDSCSIGNIQNELVTVVFKPVGGGEEYEVTNVGEGLPEGCANANEETLQNNPTLCIGDVSSAVNVDSIPVGEYIVYTETINLDVLERQEILFIPKEISNLPVRSPNAVFNLYEDESDVAVLIQDTLEVYKNANMLSVNNGIGAGIEYLESNEPFLLNATIIQSAKSQFSGLLRICKRNVIT